MPIARLQLQHAQSSPPSVHVLHAGLDRPLLLAQVLLANVDAIDWGLLPRALMGLLALLCGNGYIVGINQIYDVDIDAVNKPFLPVAAGECAGREGGRGVQVFGGGGQAGQCSQHALPACSSTCDTGEQGGGC